MDFAGLFLAIPCFDCVFVFCYVLHVLLKSTFSVEAGVRLQGQMMANERKFVCIQPDLTRTTSNHN